MKTLLTVMPILFALIACNHAADPKQIEKNVCISDSMIHMITIDTAKLCNVNNELKLSGEVSFDENKLVKVYPFSSGQVMQVNVSLGDRVKAGQALAVLTELAESRNPYRARALEELAKHYEHHVRDYAMAIEMTRSALAITDSAGLRRREERLRLRVSKSRTKTQARMPVSPSPR